MEQLNTIRVYEFILLLVLVVIVVITIKDSVWYSLHYRGKVSSLVTPKNTILRNKVPVCKSSMDSVGV